MARNGGFIGLLRTQKTMNSVFYIKCAITAMFVIVMICMIASNFFDDNDTLT